MRVKVYRNLKHGKHAPILYSVMHKGKVIDRVHRILLADAEFKVSEAGRQRVLREKRKNVHAFVTGIIVDSACGIDKDGKDLPVHMSYNPYKGAHFTNELGHKIGGASTVLLNEHGISAAYIWVTE